MAAAFGLLRVPPDVFWRMTLVELGAALRSLAPLSALPLARTELDALLERYPD